MTTTARTSPRSAASPGWPPRGRRRHTAGDYLVAFLGFTPGSPTSSDWTRRSTCRAGRRRARGCPPGRSGSPAARPASTRRLARRLAADRADRRGAVRPGPRPAGAARAGRPAAVRRVVIEVVGAGPLTTVQDRGRPGHAPLGVPRAGAADRPRARPRQPTRRQRPVGGCARDDAGRAGARSRAPGSSPSPARAARHGRRARGGARPAGGRAPGRRGRVGPATDGLRSYLAVRGGIDVPPVLGSRSTCTLSGLGPPPLRAGDRLPLGRAAGVVASPARRRGGRDLRVVLGPAPDPGRLATLLGTVDRDRAVRPHRAPPGRPELERATDEEPLSEGLVAGAVQVPPDGRPCSSSPSTRPPAATRWSPS